MGTFENTVKLNSNSILGKIVERIKNKISIEDMTTNTLTLTLDDFEELSSGFLGYKITPPEGTYISEINANILVNRSSVSSTTTDIIINHGNINQTRLSGSSVIGTFATTTLALCISSVSYYNATSRIATGFSTTSSSTTNITNYGSTSSTSTRSTYASDNDGSITIITNEPNLTNLTMHIRYKLSKS